MSVASLHVVFLSQDSELKRSCSDTALAQVKEEEEEEGEAVERKEESRRYPGVCTP